MDKTSLQYRFQLKTETKKTQNDTPPPPKKQNQNQPPTKTQQNHLLLFSCYTFHLTLKGCGCFPFNQTYMPTFFLCQHMVSSSDVLPLHNTSLQCRELLANILHYSLMYSGRPLRLWKTSAMSYKYRHCQ